PVYGRGTKPPLRENTLSLGPGRPRWREVPSPLGGSLPPRREGGNRRGDGDLPAGRSSPNPRGLALFPRRDLHRERRSSP
ncbi:MAG TPA: hypothetical protein VJ397_08000, partial [Thermoplasmata archaeon]|nr:hypothetical protein [Thermoplasmata archaeon]